MLDTLRRDGLTHDGIVYGWLNYNFTARLRQYTLLSAPARSAIGQREDPKSVDTYTALTSHPFPRVVGANMRRPTAFHAGVGPARARPDWQCVRSVESVPERARPNTRTTRDVL